MWQQLLGSIPMYKNRINVLKNAIRVLKPHGKIIVPVHCYEHCIPVMIKKDLILNKGEEVAKVIRKIYKMRKDGISTNEIAMILKREKILTPSAYAVQKGYRTPSKRSTRGEFFGTKV